MNEGYEMYFSFLARKLEMTWPYQSAADFRARNQTRLSMT